MYEIEKRFLSNLENENDEVIQKYFSSLKKTLEQKLKKNDKKNIVFNLSSFSKSQESSFLSLRYCNKCGQLKKDSHVCRR